MSDYHYERQCRFERAGNYTPGWCQAHACDVRDCIAALRKELAAAKSTYQAEHGERLRLDKELHELFAEHDEVRAQLAERTAEVERLQAKPCAHDVAKARLKG